MKSKPQTAATEPAASRVRRFPLVTVAVTLPLLAVLVVAISRQPPQRPQIVNTDVSGELFVATAPAPSTGPAASRTPKIAAPAQTLASVPPKLEGDYLQMGFDQLSGFPIHTKWVMTDPIRIKGVQQMQGELPGYILALDQKKVAVQGFMLPTRMTNGLVSDFLLLRTQARCCYGQPVQANELMNVHMTGAGVKSLMDEPITIFGTLHISEDHDPNSGILSSVYALDGEKMREPSKL